MKKGSTIFKHLFFFSLFLSVLWGNHAWFTWWIGANGPIYRLLLIVLAAIAFIFQISTTFKSKKSSNLLALFFIYLFGMAISGIPGVAFVIGTILKLYPFLVLMGSSKEVQSEALSYISKGLAIMLVPGLITYGIVLATEIPGIPYLDEKLFYIYGFVVRDMSIYAIDNFYRFPSVFLEPGYLGVLMAFLLFANNFELTKWYNKVLLVSLIASFSLGGYVVAIVAYVLSLFAKGKLKPGPILVSIMVFLLCFVLAKNINDGDNLLNHLIIERLEFSDDGKGIEGNNRFSEGTDYYYELYKGELLFGLGPEKVAKLAGAGYNDSISGAGYKVYFLTFGIASALVFLMFYALIGSTFARNRRYAFSFLIIVVITFIFQSEITSPSWYIIYALGCACCEPIILKRPSKVIHEAIN